jgi:hypothetical protein
MKFPARSQCPALRTDGKRCIQCCFHGTRLKGGIGREVYRRMLPWDLIKRREGKGREMSHTGSFPKVVASH